MPTAITLQQYEHIEPLLVRYAMRSVRSEATAHDLVQETWAAAILSLPRFEGRSSLRTWMVGILRRKIIDHHRRKRPTTPFEEERHGQPETSPENSLDEAATVRAVRAKLGTLPALERHAVELCDVHEIARDTAALELGVTDGHLRVLLHRGRKRLRHQLREAGYTL